MGIENSVAGFGMQSNVSVVLKSGIVVAGTMHSRINDALTLVRAQITLPAKTDGFFAKSIVVDLSEIAAAWQNG